MKDNYTSPYAQNVPKMYNTEVVALAKNRFTDAETQMAIAKHHYRLGHTYLARNSKITQDAAKELWSRRGYVLKSILMAHDRIDLSDQERIDVYRKYFKNKSRSEWRMLSAFLGRSYWERDKNDPQTPTVLLDEIYSDLLATDRVSRYTLQRFVDHPNCSLEMAIRISTTPDEQNGSYTYSSEDLRQNALMRVAEITKQQLEAR